MRITYLIALFTLLTSVCFGQQKIQVHNGGDTMYTKEISAIDSIKLDGTYAKFKVAGAANTLDIQKKLIDSLTFTTGTVSGGKIYIIYNGDDNATIINPYETQGVTLTAIGGTVTGTATSGIANLEYNILGSSANGTLELATDMDVNLVLKNLTLTNPSGAALSITGGKVTNVLLTPGTTNTLSDGSTSTRNGTITTDGPVVINTSVIMNNTGLLNITAVKKHGINTSSTITIVEGMTTITFAESDGFHCEGYNMSGGIANITSLGDGIDAGNGAIAISAGTVHVTSTANDVKAIKTGNGTINIAGGNINLDVSGSASKAVSAKGIITLNGGTYVINLSGAALLTASGSGYDPSYCTGIKSDVDINIYGGTFTINGAVAADGGKAFSSGGTITIANGTFNITTAGGNAAYVNTTGGSSSYSTTAFSTDGDINVSGGMFTLINTGNEGKQFSSDGAINVTGGTININNSGAAGRGFTADGNIVFAGGNTTINLSGATLLNASGSGFNPSYPTGIKADGTITVNTGTIISVTGTAAATGAKGLAAENGVIINDGSVTTLLAGNGGSYTTSTGAAGSYSAGSISSDADITIAGGTIGLTNSGSDSKNINTDANIIVNGGTINLTNSGAAGKGYKADGNVTFNGGNSTINLSGPVVLTTSGSGSNPSYPSGVKADGSITVNSGIITVTATSAATGARGFSADKAIVVADGTINVTVAGNGAKYTNTSGVQDSYSAAAFSADSALTITGGSVTTASSGTGGKGLKSDGSINIGSASGNPVLNVITTGARFVVSGTDYNHPKTMVATGAVNIINGSITLTSTDDGIHSDTIINISGGNTKITASSTQQGVGEGIEAPRINFTGGVTNVTASNDGINATFGTVSGGTESNDHSQLNISGGILIVAGSDAIDSNGDITITGGTTIVCGPTNQPEEGMDYNGTFLMNGGYLIAAGSSSNMTKAMAASSAQVSMYLKSSAQLATSSMLHIENTSGTEMVTFKPKNGVYYFHFSTASLSKSTQYNIYFGGSYTGGNFVGNSTGWGLYTGGTYSNSGAALKKTLTTSATATVNTVTF